MILRVRRRASSIPPAVLPLPPTPSVSCRPAPSRALLLTLPALVFAAGCGDSGAGSRQVFASAVEADLDPDCFEVPSRFPNFLRGVAFSPNASDSALAMRGPEPIPALFRVGFVKPTLGDVDLLEDGAGFRIPQVRYELTEAGKAAYRDSLPESGDPGFCFATRKLEKILEVYEPEEASPKGAAQNFVAVTYTYRSEPAAWARHPAIGEQFPVVRPALRNEVEPAIAYFVQTEAGWRVADDTTMASLLGDEWAQEIPKGWREVMDRAMSDVLERYGPR